MNKAVLMGRLTRDPDTRYTQGEQQTCISRYTLAVDRPRRQEGQQGADYISCVAFGRLGEFAENYLRKGMKIAVTGRIQTGRYTNRDGQKVYTTDVVIESQEFCESKASNDRARGSSSAGDSQETAGVYDPEKADADGFMDIPDQIDDDLPFH